MVATRPNDTQHPAEVSITILERKTRRNKPRPRLNATVPGRDEGRLLNAHHLVSDPRARQYDVRLWGKPSQASAANLRSQTERRAMGS
jgi:hypothetical protein